MVGVAVVVIHLLDLVEEAWEFMHVDAIFLNQVDVVEENPYNPVLFELIIDRDIEIPVLDLLNRLGVLEEVH